MKMKEYLSKLGISEKHWYELQACDELKCPETPIDRENDRSFNLCEYCYQLWLESEVEE